MVFVGYLRGRVDRLVELESLLVTLLQPVAVLGDEPRSVRQDRSRDLVGSDPPKEGRERGPRARPCIV